MGVRGPGSYIYIYIRIIMVYHMDHDVCIWMYTDMCILNLSYVIYIWPLI